MRYRNRLLITIMVLILEAAIAVSGFMLIRRHLQTRASEKVLALEREAVTVLPAAESVSPAAAGAGEYLPEEQTAEQSGEQLERPPVIVDFEYLQAINPDVKGWLYCPGTEINFALMQSTNNDYYLSHLADGSRGPYGSVFLDYRCSGDFSDLNTLVYGHDMQNGSMFGGVDYYSDQSYYEEHSVMYLLTPEHNYRLDAVCGFIHTIELSLYNLPAEATDLEYSVWTGIARSTFSSSITPGMNDSFVTLSTCAYDFEGARYALMLKMTEIGK